MQSVSPRLLQPDVLSIMSSNVYLVALAFRLLLCKGGWVDVADKDNSTSVADPLRCMSVSSSPSINSG